ncbi:hypothetical protein Corgl_0066 [Coriobacterium glomerans PW2]|uniref:Uncharacterized protein n=1 Tax=Coriobacterium glomerans (strain ATCC 49209 / DSM 20642 / JCM 10262 / PW2) TaxID=700015 RepID=F2N6Z5_CORGP|nr:hypothetical protein Corgl_0066 [Coriobacterium glomerans PW2]
MVSFEAEIMNEGLQSYRIERQTDTDRAYLVVRNFCANTKTLRELIACCEHLGWELIRGSACSRSLYFTTVDAEKPFDPFPTSGLRESCIIKRCFMIYLHLTTIKAATPIFPRGASRQSSFRASCDVLDVASARGGCSLGISGYRMHAHPASNRVWTNTQLNDALKRSHSQDQDQDLVARLYLARPSVLAEDLIHSKSA